MEASRIENAAVRESSGRRIALAAASAIDRFITVLCRFVVLATGIALTVIMTASVAARYVLASGGIDAAQELPERLFPWFIVAGFTLAAQAGGHMSVEWLLGKLDLAPALRQCDCHRLLPGSLPSGTGSR
jgi:TRAP-type C4-dicarboxylate transport system permease small subunit